MRLRIGLVGILSSLIGFYACVAGARQWVDVTGQHKVEATFVSFKDGEVRLKKESGETISVPLTKLREEDQKFVIRMILHAKEAGADAPTAEPAASSDTPTAKPAASSEAPKAQPVASSTPPQEAMFEVVKTEIVEKPVEVNGCRVTPKNGCVLYVCTVNFTKAGMALSHETLNKLKIDAKSKNLSKKSTKGILISKGDFCLRLGDDTTVACYCLPGGDAAQGLPIRPARTRGSENWLMYCGNVRFLASVKPDVKPEALVWGGAYEAKVMPPTTAAAAKEPAKTAVAQVAAPPMASPGPSARRRKRLPRPLPRRQPRVPPMPMRGKLPDANNSRGASRPSTRECFVSCWASTPNWNRRTLAPNSSTRTTCGMTKTSSIMRRSRR